jgi:hypothetical protein
MWPGVATNQTPRQHSFKLLLSHFRKDGVAYLFPRIQQYPNRAPNAPLDNVTLFRSKKSFTACSG